MSDDWIEDEDRTDPVRSAFDRDVVPLQWEELRLAGSSFRPKNVDAYMRAPRDIWAQAEPDNPHDANAVAVMARWTWKNGRDGEGRVGYIPREVAAVVDPLAAADRLAVRPVAFILAVPDRGLLGTVVVALGERSSAAPPPAPPPTMQRPVARGMRATQPTVTDARPAPRAARRRSGAGCAVLLLAVVPVLAVAMSAAAVARAVLGGPK